MPAPAWLGPALGAGTGIAGGIIAASAQGKRDHDARNFALMQGEIEWKNQLEAWGLMNKRDDETWNRQNEYNMMLWNKQNEYNSPAAQMARYKEAGLNPNLIYGQSNLGGNVATSNLDSGRIGSYGRPSNWNPGVPDYSFIGNAVKDAMAFREKAAQVNNLEAQNDVLKQEEMLKAATTAHIALQSTGQGISNKSQQFDLDLKGDLRQTQINAAQENLRKTQIESDVMLRRDERESIQSNQSLLESAERIMNMRGERMNNMLRGELLKLDLMLKDVGPIGTDMMNRMLGRILQYGYDGAKQMKGIYDFFNRR